MTIPHFIYHLSSLIILQGVLDIAGPSSIQDACHSEPSKYELANAVSLPVSQWLEHLTSVRLWVQFP